MNEDMIWAKNLIDKIERKYRRTTERTQIDFFPYTNKDNRFVPSEYEENYNWWTNGFYPGILWKLYLFTKDNKYKALAEHYEDLLDIPLNNYDGLHHDVGFMWLTSAGANYKITGNEKSRKRTMLAANILAARYNIEGGFIRAWNGDDNEGWAIIDSMMNIPILYFASRESRESRFCNIAKRHADKVMENFIREDGSVRHIVSFDVKNGNMVEELAGQGYEKGSAWSRGASWAIYGFVLSYLYTREEKYLMASKKAAHYFISNLILQEDFIPVCDFRSPQTPVYKDTTAGVIAACGLIELSRVVPENEKNLYRESAVKILKSIEKYYCLWDENVDGIVGFGTERYGKGTNMHIIYGDYFFIEALMKLLGDNILFW